MDYFQISIYTWNMMWYCVYLFASEWHLNIKRQLKLKLDSSIFPFSRTNPLRFCVFRKSISIFPWNESLGIGMERNAGDARA